ncbi:thioredoxin [Nocardia sp. NPDC055029]
MSDSIQSVTDADFSQQVLAAEKPVLVDFWATWCAPCKKVAPVLEEIAAENADKLIIVKMDLDDNPRTAKDYRVMSAPTLILFQGGQPVKQIAGAKPKAALLAELSDVLA